MALPRQPHGAYLGPRWTRVDGPAPATLVAACEGVARRYAGGRLRPLLGVVMRHADEVSDPDGVWFVRALARWARSVRHVREPIAFGEMIAPPDQVLREGWGDCDDVATAVCAVAATVGIPCRLRWYETSHNGAHMVAVVKPGWYSSGSRWPEVVIDQLADTDALSVGL